MPLELTLTQRGGAVIANKRILSGIKLDLNDWVSSFEMMEVVLDLRSQVMHLAVFYRPGSFMDGFHSSVEGFSHKSGKQLISSITVLMISCVNLFLLNLWN